MKKVIIIGVISVVFAVSNTILGTGDISYANSQESTDLGVDVSKESLNVKHLEIMEKQLKATNDIYRSITSGEDKTGIRITSRKSNDNGDLLLLNPENIYDKNKQSALSTRVSTLFKNIQEEEQKSIGKSFQESSVRTMRNLIEKRSQYAAVMDKVVSLRVFEQVEKRFEQIAQHLIDVQNTKDMKSITELQAHIKGTLAMIQNEATKLQMVKHLRNVERTLIRQQKYKRNIKILSHANTQMPTIRYDAMNSTIR